MQITTQQITETNISWYWLRIILATVSQHQHFRLFDTPGSMGGYHRWTDGGKTTNPLGMIPLM